MIKTPKYGSALHSILNVYASFDYCLRIKYVYNHKWGCKTTKTLLPRSQMKTRVMNKTAEYGNALHSILNVYDFFFFNYSSLITYVHSHKWGIK